MNDDRHVSLNGAELRTGAATLLQLLEGQGFDLGAAMACAVNARFVPRAQWPAHPLTEGDRIDVIAPVTGG